MKSIGRLSSRLLLNGPQFIRWAGMNAYGLRLRIRRFGGAYEELSRWLEQTESWQPEAIRAWQIARLRQMLVWAGGSVEYYREKFANARFDPVLAELPSELFRLPLLTKDIIRRNGARLVEVRTARRYAVEEYSSGTTGQRLEFWLPRVLAHNLNAAIMWRQYRWAGIRRGERRVTLGGRDFTRRAPYSVRNHAEAQLLLSIHCLNNATLDHYLESIRSYAPAFVQGNPSGLAFLAEKLVAMRSRIPVRAVFTTGETLTTDQRGLIQEAFSCPVLESYGLGESVVAAQQCERQKGFHEVSELGFLELAHSDTHGLKTVVGTSLWNDAMPFIRYQIEDLVEPATESVCPCGRGLPIVFNRVVGRIDDTLHDVDGHGVFAVTIRMVVKPELDPFENYQVTQSGRERYEVTLTGSKREEKEQRIAAALQAVLGGGRAKIYVRYAEQLYTAGGKVRNVINLMKQEGRAAAAGAR